MEDFLLSFVSSRGGELHVCPLWSQRHEGDFLKHCHYRGRRWIWAIAEGVLSTPGLLQVHRYVNENYSNGLFRNSKYWVLKKDRISPLNVCSGWNCCLQYLVGETDISSMTELIKSLRHFLYQGFRNFKGWGLGREELWACDVELAGGWKQQVQNLSSVLLQGSGVGWGWDFRKIRSYHLWSKRKWIWGKV